MSCNWNDCAKPMSTPFGQELAEHFSPRALREIHEAAEKREKWAFREMKRLEETYGPKSPEYKAAERDWKRLGILAIGIGRFLEG